MAEPRYLEGDYYALNGTEDDKPLIEEDPDRLHDEMGEE